MPIQPSASEQPSKDPTVEAANSQNIRSFGVGCFHFGIRNRPAEALTPQDYVAKLKEFLSKYPNIEFIRCTPEVYSSSHIDGDLDDEGSIQSGDGISPWPCHWTLTFRLNLPALMQQALLEEEYPLESEKFDIVIVYEEDFPVAFVEGVECKLESPSTAVVLCRRYLEKYDKKDSEIEFQFIGPSPFHADFFVAFNGGRKRGKFETESTPGYDKIKIAAQKAQIPSAQAPYLLGLYHVISLELGIYYNTIQARNRLNDQWYGIEGVLDELVNQARNSISRIWRKYNYRWRSALEEVALEIISFKLLSDREYKHICSSKEGIAERYQLGNLLSYTEEEVQAFQEYPIQDLTKIVETLERRL